MEGLGNLLHIRLERNSECRRFAVFTIFVEQVGGIAIRISEPARIRLSRSYQ
jgi:hypothetical protein